MLRIEKLKNLIHITQVERALDNLTNSETTPDFSAIQECIFKIYPEYRIKEEDGKTFCTN